MDDIRQCPLCGAAERASVLAESGWVDEQVERRIRTQRPEWRRADGACPACLQRALLTFLLEKGEATLARVVQDVWPLDAEAAFGALPTPLRLRADPRFTGHGVTVAVVDAGFYPHPDLIRPTNRIRAWVNAATDAVDLHTFGPDDTPVWPGSDAGTASQWHGLMTSTTLAGNGWLSHGLYRGLASDAELVLVQVLGSDGRIGAKRVLRALRWLTAHHHALGIRIVNLSLGVEPSIRDGMDEIVGAVTSLVLAGVTVVVAAGNDGERHLVPPATAPDALTVGGLDDRNMFDAQARALWHSNFGNGANGRSKPELVAPSIWVVAPVLPGTETAREALDLFARRASLDQSVEQRIAEQHLVTPYYQHVEGTSFASPIVSGVIACMLEAHPTLEPTRIRTLLELACEHVNGAADERQGAGAIDAGRAVANALAVARGAGLNMPRSPVVQQGRVQVTFLDHRARTVELLGSWDDWGRSVPALRAPNGEWTATLGPLTPGTYAYKLRVDGIRWVADVANPLRSHDGHGGWNSSLEVRST
ncbi:MAG: S8 family serine peptidase [Gemmatimonadaceae bacterium]